MKYKVQTALIDKLEDGDMFRVVAGWVEADNQYHAATLFMLDQPVPANFEREYLDPILVVDRNYNMGNYKHAGIDVAGDYEVGLRNL